MREWARTWTGAPIPLSDFSVVVWFDPDRELRPLRAAAFSIAIVP